MKKEGFTRSDGSKDFANIPEVGDVVTAEFDKVGQSERAVNDKEGKAIIVKNAYLGVITAEGEKLTIKITQGQKKVLDKEPSLKGRKIKFEEYTHKQYGKQIGARVLESTEEKVEEKKV